MRRCVAGFSLSPFSSSGLSDVPVGKGFLEVEYVAVGEGEVILDPVVDALVGGEAHLGQVSRFRVVVCCDDGQLVAAAVERGVCGPAVLPDLDEMQSPDVVRERVLGAEYGVHPCYREGVVIEPLNEPQAPDRQGLGAVLAAPVSEGTAVGPGVPGVRFLALGDVSVNSA